MCGLICSSIHCLTACIEGLQVGNDGIMVGKGYGVIDKGSVGFPVFGTKNVINTYNNCILIKRASKAAPAAAVGIGESRAHLVVSIRNGSVIEVAHQYNFFALMAV